MGGRSQLSSEVLSSKLEGVDHDNQTLDIRDLETLTELLKHSSSFYNGTVLPTTNLFVGREYFHTTQKKLYRLSQVSPATWVVTEDLNAVITNQQAVDDLGATLTTLIGTKLNSSAAGSTGLSLLATISAAAARTVLSAAKSGLITDSDLTINANKFLGRSTTGVGAIEELSSVIPFIPQKSITRDLLHHSTVMKIARLNKPVTGCTVYRANGVLTEDGTLMTWGRTNTYNMGANIAADTMSVTAPALFYPRIPNGEKVIDFVITGETSYAVLSNGWVYSCGINSYGALGHGDTSNRPAFTRINYFIANSISISEVVSTGPRQVPAATGVFFISTDRKKMYACGYNNNGQLGNASLTNQLTPFLTYDAGSDTIKKVVITACHQATGYILTNGGYVLATGYNLEGQCGDGTATQRTSWGVVSGGLIGGGSGIVDIDATAGWTTASSAVRSGHIAALHSNGSLYTWGYNAYGQLGLGDTTNRTTPVLVPGLGSTVLKFGTSGGIYGWTYIYLSNGYLAITGYNGQGQLGQGDTTNRTSFTAVSTSAENIAALPPFQGKIKLLCHNGASNGHNNLIVLDTDERLWFAGYDYSLYINNATATTINRFTEILYNLDSLDEKIIDIVFNGYDGTYSHHILTNHGKVYGIGEFTYGSLDGQSYVNNYPNPSRRFIRLLRS